MAEIESIFSKEAVDQLVKVAQHMATIDSSISAIKTTQADAAAKMGAYGEAVKQVEKATKDQASAMAALEKQRAKGLEQMAKAEAQERDQEALINKEAKSLYELQKQLLALTKARNKLDITTKEGQKALAVYNQRIDANTEKIRANNDAAGKQRMNIGNYGSALKGVGNQLLAFASGIGIGIGAMQAFKAVMNATGSLSDTFARNIEGLKQGFQFLGKSIASLDFTNLVKGFANAVAEGKRYADTLDEIQDRQVSLGMLKADAEYQMAQQKLIMKSAWKTNKEKEAAIEEYLRILKSTATVEKDLTDDTYKNELENIVKTSLGVAEFRQEQQDLLVDYVRNSTSYEDRIKEAAKLQAELNSLITEESMIIGDQVVRVENTNEYNKAMKNLNDEQKLQLDLLKISKALTDEQRKSLGEKYSASKQAQTGEILSELEVQKVRNSLYNEFIKGEEGKVAEIEKTNDIFEKQSAGMINDLQKFITATGKADEIIEEAFDIPSPEKKVDPWLTALDEIKKFSKDSYDQTAEAQAASQRKQLADLEMFHSMGLISEIEYQAALKKIRDGEEESERERRLREQNEKIQAASMLGEALYTIGSTMMDIQMNDLEKQKAYELEQAGDNAEKKEAIEQKYQIEENKLRTKQAKADKAQAVFKAALDFAKAMMVALSAGPPPFNLILASITAAAAGVHMAAIAAAPIPKFAKGTGRAPGGLAWVGEQGHELIAGPGGVALSPGTATLVNLGKGGQRIYNNRETRAIMQAAKGADSQEVRQLAGVLHDDNMKLIETVRNKSELHIAPSGRRITERKGNYARHYFDRKIG